MKRYIEEFGKDVSMKMNGKLLVNSKLSLTANNFAKEKGKFPEFHEAVFKTNLEQGKNIGDMELLLNIGEETGLNRQELKIYLEDEGNL
jgi:predicted DsbA family dithiol-disulfide isomerase